ncbi:MAG: ABC transporter permease [Anaerolineales bacterium]|jgi:ABC-type lipoprotein release transport system permease subunit
MNPLSPWIYHRRHKRHAALIFGLILLVTAGLYIMGAVLWSVFIEPPRVAFMALSKFSLVTPVSGSTVMDDIAANPDVEEILPTTSVAVDIPTMMPGETITLRLFALNQEDLPYVLERYNATLKEGRLLERGTNGLLLSDGLAKMLSLNVGDTYEMISAEIYGESSAPLEATPMEVVGIIESEVRLGFISLEYLKTRELYRNYPSRYLIAAKEGRHEVLDDFLRNEIYGKQADVQTFEMLNERVVSEALPALAVLTPAVLIVTAAFAQVVVVVNRIDNLRRLPEFGILNATGRSRKWLIRRLTGETTTISLAGWVIGIALACLIIYIANLTIFIPQGQYLSFITWAPLVLVISIPVASVGLTAMRVRRTLTRLDPVAVIERGELSQEAPPRSKERITQSSPKPMAPALITRRHKRQSLLVVGMMGVIIFAVTLIIFILGVSADAQEPFWGYLRKTSFVRSSGIISDLDPTANAKLEAHPSVERVIPTAPRFHMISAWIPPFVTGEASPFAVYAEDMTYLVELYDLELKEGHLPRPGTNEIVISESLSRNRDLVVGDSIGDPDHPAYPGAEALPSIFIVSGIFSHPPSPEEENWWGFISLEYIEDEEIFPLPDNLPVFVVAKEGQKEILNSWLVSELVSIDTQVFTYEQEIIRNQQNAQNQILSMVMLQAVIALVAAMGMAILNYIYIKQRQGEFGILLAIGYSRKALVRRVLQETMYTVAIAWSFSALITFLAMLYLRFGIFEPIGLSFNLLKITPWLYTLPIPLIVLAVTGVSTARIISKSDPISIIEKQSH